MNPIRNVTDPQSINASDAPRRREANRAGDIRVGTRLLAVAASTGGREGPSAGGDAR